MISREGKNRLWAAALAVVTSALSGCAAPEPKYVPPIPILNLMEATRSFEKDLYRTIEPESFEKALIRHPSSRGSGDIFVPVGGYFSTRLVDALPDDGRVSLIRLDRFASVCGGQSFFLPASLRCSVDLGMTVMVGGKEHRILFAGERDVGPILVPGNLSRPLDNATNRNMVTLRMLHAQARVVANYAADATAQKIRAVLGDE